MDPSESIPVAFTQTIQHSLAENGILLYYQLLLQVPRAHRYRVSCPQEKTTRYAFASPPHVFFPTTFHSIPSRLPSFRHRTPLLLSVEWSNQHRMSMSSLEQRLYTKLQMLVLDRDYSQLGSSRLNVYGSTFSSPLVIYPVPDYYYYATAGGAKIWVRYMSSQRHLFC